MKKICILLSMGVFVALSFLPALAQQQQNTRALGDLKTVKVYFDVKTKSINKVVTQLGLIIETYGQIKKAGVEPRFIVGFRNEASNFVTQGEDDYIFEEDAPAKKKVQTLVQRLKKRGIIMEQCGITAELYEIDLEDFLPELEIIQNSYISMIGYQAQGYSQLTMD